jgi:hypothetical protein
MRTNYQNVNFLASINDEDTIVDRKVWIQETSKLSGYPKKKIEEMVKQFLQSADGHPWAPESTEAAIWESLERDGFYIEEQEQDDDLPEEGEVKFSDVVDSLLVEDDEEEQDDHQAMWQLRKYRAGYVKTKEGKKTHIDCGDELAEKLRSLDLEGVYQVASAILGLTVDMLKDKYGHLNNGQQRMNLGNRIRAFQKKAEAEAA